MSVLRWHEGCPVVFGTGAINMVGDEAKKFGMSNIMLITEDFLVKAGIVDPISANLEKAGITVTVWGKVEANPKGSLVNEGAAVARGGRFDGIIAVGGGSTLDCAKAVAKLTGNPGGIEDYYSYSMPIDYHNMVKGIPVICIPTTSGTGSEGSQWCVISDENGVKQGPVYFADLALIDPVLTYSVPPSVTAATGLDALAHCMETITSAGQNYFTDALAYEGIRMVFEWLPTAVNEPENAEAREKMAVAANFGGMTMVENSTSFGHLFGDSFCGQFHEPHGLCCSWGTPGTIILAALFAENKAKRIADCMGIRYEDDITSEKLKDAMLNKVKELCKVCKLPTPQEKGYSLENFLSIAEIMFSYPSCHTGPAGEMTMDQLKEYIELCYKSFE